MTGFPEMPLFTVLSPRSPEVRWREVKLEGKKTGVALPEGFRWTFDFPGWRR